MDADEALASEGGPAPTMLSGVGWDRNSQQQQQGAAHGFSFIDDPSGLWFRFKPLRRLGSSASPEIYL